MKKFVLLVVISFLSVLCHAQLLCQFIVHEGMTYMAVTSQVNFTYYFNWKIYNPYSGQNASGLMQSIKPQETLYFGPETLEWIWEDGEHFEINYNRRTYDYVYHDASSSRYNSGSNRYDDYNGYGSNNYESNTRSSRSAQRKEKVCHMCGGSGKCCSMSASSASIKSHCNGSGKCGWCSGKGWVYSGSDVIECGVCRGKKKCTSCYGTGECKYCNGKGTRYR